MEPIANMLQQTGQHAARQRNVLVGRTRNATRTFAAETRGASKDFFSFIRSEAKRWQKWAQKRVDHTADAVFGSLAPKAIERQLLTRVDHTLRAIDARVRNRLSSLDKSRAPKARRAKAPRKARKAHARPNGAAILA